MDNDRIRLPKALRDTPDKPTSEAVELERLRNERSHVETSARVDTAKLNVLKEGLSVLRSFADVARSKMELETTRVEWLSRIEVAERSLLEAQESLEKARDDNKTRREAIALQRTALEPTVRLFDEMMADLNSVGLSEEARASLRSDLLSLSSQLVKLTR